MTSCPGSGPLYQLLAGCGTKCIPCNSTGSRLGKLCQADLFLPNLTASLFAIQATAPGQPDTKSQVLLASHQTHSHTTPWAQDATGTHLYHPSGCASSSLLKFLTRRFSWHHHLAKPPAALPSISDCMGTSSWVLLKRDGDPIVLLSHLSTLSTLVIPVLGTRGWLCR